MISFTGSTTVGRTVGDLAGRHLKRAHLELGGNSALIVLDDADVDEAVTLAAWGSFFNRGQICMTTGRTLVAGSLYTHQVAPGPLIDAGQRDKVHRLVTASVSAGARLAAGGFVPGVVLPTHCAGRRADQSAALLSGV